MKRTALNSIIIIAFAVAIFSGCVASNRLERQGTKAYIAKDFQTAVIKYNEAIADGSIKANYHLAVMYAQGEGVEQNYSKAAELLKTAEAKGDNDARVMLGLFNVYGDGVPANPEKGAKLISIAAEEGSDVAMYYLGHLYAAGLGVEKDIPMALKWMKKANKKGFPVKKEFLSVEGLKKLY